jgi:hypothetical protein
MQRLESRFKYLIYPGKPPVCSGTGFATIKAPADVRIFQPGPWAYLPFWYASWVKSSFAAYRAPARSGSPSDLAASNRFYPVAKSLCRRSSKHMLSDCHKVKRPSIGWA